jgi:PAS domain S-box-containing protein
VHQPPLANTEANSGQPEVRLLSAIVNSSDDAIIGKTPDGKITSWNTSAARIYGYSAEEIIGQPMEILCPPDRVGEIRQILETINRGERVNHFETERRRKDGTTFHASVTVSPIYDEQGNLAGASSIARDLTEQRQLRLSADLHRHVEEANRAQRSLQSFTHSVSHDLRAPLRAMNGFSQCLLDEYGDVLDEAGRGYAERIQAAGDQMATLIDDLGRLSQVMQAEMHLETVDLGSVAEGIAGQLQRDEPERSVRFVIERPVQAKADHALIRTALRNILENAWKFTAPQADALIEFGRTPTMEAAVCCYVRDNGVGFDPAYADQLFQPFRRLHSASEFPGTGVGLAMVRQIVERHGGRAWAEGAVGEGATLYFTLGEREMLWRAGLFSWSRTIRTTRRSRCGR